MRHRVCLPQQLQTVAPFSPTRTTEMTKGALLFPCGASTD